MGWRREGEAIAFDGALGQLMEMVMFAYASDERAPSEVTPGTWVMAAALTLRSMVMTALDESEASEALRAQVAAGVSETEDGDVNVQTLEILDAIAEGVDMSVLHRWLNQKSVKHAISELAVDTLARGDVPAQPDRVDLEKGVDPDAT